MKSQPQTSLPAKAGIRADRLPNLDGFRAISIGMVLSAHCTQVENFPKNLRGVWGIISSGDLGVRFFFVISGFIITWLLLREAARKGVVSLSGFWARRSVRILPAYAVFVLALVLLQWTTPWHMAPLGWLGVLTFTSDFYHPEHWLPFHLWSLSVEEQFYLLWPLTFAWLRPWNRPRTALVVLASVIVSCIISQWIGGPSPTIRLWSGYFFLRRSDSIALGCIGAIVLWHYRPQLSSFFSRSKGWLIGTMLFAIALPKILEALRLIPPSHFAGSTAIEAVGLIVVLIWSQLEPNHIAFRMLQLRPIVLIGTWSYSIYLWQQVFSSNAATFGLDSTPWWLSFPGWLIPSILFGMASFYLVEQPIRSWYRNRKTLTAKPV